MGYEASEIWLPPPHGLVGTSSGAGCGVPSQVLGCIAVSILPPFLLVTDARKNNTLGVRSTCFLVKKGGQKAPISPGRKIREPCGPDDRS